MKPLYIFDLDGTLANVQHRVQLKEAKRWEEFFAACQFDEPIRATIHTLDSLAEEADIWVWTGRSADTRAKTITWFLHHNVAVDHLRMRSSKDHRPDHVIKKEWLDSLDAVDRDRLVAVFEDRKSVVDMWRTNNITCYQVAEGNF